MKELDNLLPREALLMFAGTVFVDVCSFSGVVVPEDVG
jgi:hypothetical protein